MTKESISKEKQWFIKCSKVNDYHKQKIKEQISNKRKIKWTIRDTARELNLSTGLVSESIKLTKALEVFPELKKESRDSALRFVRVR